MSTTPAQEKCGRPFAAAMWVLHIAPCREVAAQGSWDHRFDDGDDERGEGAPVGPSRLTCRAARQQATPLKLARPQKRTS